jgi:hypothetical protein
MGADSCRARTLKARNRELAQALAEAEARIEGLIRMNEKLDRERVAAQRVINNRVAPSSDLVDDLLAYLEREVPFVRKDDDLQAIQAFALLKIVKAVSR